jgi:hypothetical protein
MHGRLTGLLVILSGHVTLHKSSMEYALYLRTVIVNVKSPDSRDRPDVPMWHGPLDLDRLLPKFADAPLLSLSKVGERSMTDRHYRIGVAETKPQCAKT